MEKFGYTRDTRPKGMRQDRARKARRARGRSHHQPVSLSLMRLNVLMCGQKETSSADNVVNFLRVASN